MPRCDHCCRTGRLTRRARVRLLALMVGASVPPAAPTVARSEGSACSLACPALDCYLEAGQCHLRAKDHREAKALLKPLLPRYPRSRTLRLLLSRAYLGLGNLPWARRMAMAAQQSAPGDCQVRSWRIWLRLHAAELEEAAALLTEKGCPDTSTMRLRWALLETSLARYRKRTAEARQGVARARREPEAYREDRDHLVAIQADLFPEERPPVRLRVDFGTGYTSNGQMSTPVDRASAATATGSPTVSLDLRADLEPRWGRRIRPVLGLSVHGLVLGAEAVADYTYVDFAARPGIRAGSVSGFYAGQLFLLRGGDRYTAGDGPRWFYETHRGELEWEPRPWLTLWGGGGRSIFREEPRTRTEVDVGVGLLDSFRRWRVLGGLSLRHHHASHAAYDLWGATLIGSVSRAVGAFGLRARLLLGFDIHPRSSGYFETDEIRRDLLLKAAIEIWTRPWHGVRAGLSYELTDRFSSAGVYAYVDHRPLFRLSWSFDWDPWLPRVAGAGVHHVPLPYGGTTAGGAVEEERIQDLLRQEDAARRGSSCIN